MSDDRETQPAAVPIRYSKLELVYFAGIEVGRQQAFAAIIQAVRGQQPLPVEVFRARSGKVKSLVRTFVLAANEPVTEQQFARSHPDVKRSSRNMAFRALEKQGVIARRGNRWTGA